MANETVFFQALDDVSGRVCHSTGFPTFFVASFSRQRTEQEDLRRQLEDNSSLAERALREEMDKSHEEQKRRHQVRSARHIAIASDTFPLG